MDTIFNLMIIISMVILSFSLIRFVMVDEFERSQSISSIIISLISSSFAFFAKLFLAPMLPESFKNLKNNISKNTKTTDSIINKNFEKTPINIDFTFPEIDVKVLLSVLAVIVSIILLSVFIYIKKDIIVDRFKKSKIYKKINKEGYEKYELYIKTKELQQYIDKLIDIQKEILLSCDGNIDNASEEFKLSFNELSKRISNLQEQLEWLPAHEKLHRFIEEDIDILEKSKDGRSEKSLDILNSYMQLTDNKDLDIEKLIEKYK